MSTPLLLSVVLPAYEEAENLVQVLPSLHRVLKEIGVPYEIIVVDAQEIRDATPQVCENHGVIYLPRVGGKLYSHAVITGVGATQGQWVVCMDADGSHGPAMIANLWREREKADLVIASRYTSGGKTENPAVLVLMSFVVNVVFRLALGLKCLDVSNSFRLYRGDDLRALKLECENFDIVEEILVKLCFSHAGYRVLEIPFTFEKRKAGKTKRDLFAFAISYFATLVMLVKLKRQIKKGKGRP